MILLVLSGGVFAAGTVYVDNVRGDDRNDGSKERPVACVQKGLDLLEDSGTLEVVNTGKPYQRPYPGEKGKGLYIRKGGTFDAPLRINGNGAVLTGLAVIPPEKWTPAEGGLLSLPFWPMSNMYKGYRKQNYWLDAPQIWWVDGEAAPNCKSLDELRGTPGGFWWNKAEKRVLFHLPAGKKLSEIKVELPGNFGFYITGDHTIVRDFYFIHSWNDGFDAAGKNQNGVFKNCVAIDNCGQGFSCHDSSNIYYEDCVAIRCASSGSCDVHYSSTRYHRCIFLDSAFEAGIYATDESTHLYSDCIISGSRPFEQIWQRQHAALTFDNCLILGLPGRNILALQNGTVAFRQCTIMDGAALAELDGRFRGSLILENCLAGNFSAPVLTVAAGEEPRLVMYGNLFFGAPGLKLGDRLYGAEDGEALRARFPRDDSAWLPAGETVAGRTASVKLKNRYGRPVRVGAAPPKALLARYETMKKARATPAGVFFD